MYKFLSRRAVPLLLFATSFLMHQSNLNAQSIRNEKCFRERRRFELSGAIGYRWKGPAFWYVNAEYSSESFFPYLGIKSELSLTKWLSFTHQASYQNTRVKYDLESPVYGDKRGMGISDRFSIVENTLCFQANEGPVGIYAGIRLVSTLHVKCRDIYDRKIPMVDLRKNLSAFCGGININAQKNVEVFGQMVYGLAPMSKGIMFENHDQSKLRYASLEIGFRYRLLSKGKVTNNWDQRDMFQPSQELP